MSRLSGWCAFLAVAVALVPMRASAQRVAILAPRVTGSRDVGNAARDGFRNSLAGGLIASGHEIVADADVDPVLRRTPALAACDTDTCFRKLGELVGAQAVVRTAVEVLGSSNYQVRVEIYDVGDRGLITTVEDACTICTAREANDAISRAAAEAGRRLTARVAPRPAQPEPQAVAAPVAEPAPVPPPRTRAPLYTGLGVTALVLGLGAAGAGAGLLAINGRKHMLADTMPDMPVLDTVTTTLVPGVILTVAGAALVVGGSVLLWRASVARHRR